MNRITKILVLIPLFFLGPSTTPRTAHAAETNFGAAVIACFHPDATFTSATYTRGHGGRGWTGWLKFHEGRRDGAMSFVMDMKTRNGDSFFRVTPLMDDGLSAPASGCYLREWQRY